jgi:hypothetical protein
MKKTIAILLVLVIGMAGVFAANTHADLELTTEIEGFNILKITAAEPNVTTLEEFNSIAPVPSKLVETDEETPVGYLSYITNKGVDIYVSIAATHFVSPNTSTAIGYAVQVGTNTAINSQTSGEYANLTQSSAITLAATSGELSIDSEVIKVDIVDTDFSNAAADTDYTANVYFTYSTI